MTRLMGTLIGLLLNGRVKIERVKLVLQYAIGGNPDLDGNMHALLAPLTPNIQTACAVAKTMYYILQNSKEDPSEVIYPLFVAIKDKSRGKTVDLVGSELAKDVFYLANSNNKHIL